jgi:hypothetical protein
MQLARDSDTVARLGGDEFALICPNLHDSEDIGHFCDRIVEGIAKMECLRGKSCVVHASISVATYPRARHQHRRTPGCRRPRHVSQQTRRRQPLESGGTEPLSSLGARGAPYD